MVEFFRNGTAVGVAFADVPNEPVGARPWAGDEGGEGECLFGALIIERGYSGQCVDIRGVYKGWVKGWKDEGMG